MLELLITFGVLLSVVGIIAASFFQFRRRVVVDNAAGEVVGLLREARAFTLASRDGAAWGVHFEADAVTLFRGPTYTSGAAGNKAVRFASAVTLATTSIAGGGSDILFKKLTGESAPFGTTTISLVVDPTKARAATVSSTGVIDLK